MGEETQGKATSHFHPILANLRNVYLQNEQNIKLVNSALQTLDRTNLLKYLLILSEQNIIEITLLCHLVNNATKIINPVSLNIHNT